MGKAEETWEGVLAKFRQDPRWDLTSGITLADKRDLFHKHMDRLFGRKLQAFAMLMRQHDDLELGMDYEDVKAAVGDEPRFLALGDTDAERQKAYASWSAQEHKQALSDFQDLLTEVKCIDHTSWK